ncbi:hypothetical protein Bca101_010833 [Brassica carinata]
MSSSLGVFREEKIDEESVLVYTLTQPDPDNPTSFFCPYARIKTQKLKLEEENADQYEVYPVTSSSPFPRRRSGDDQQGESLLDSNQPDICKLSVVLNVKGVEGKIKCGACVSSRVSKSHYACLQCRQQFHKECVECPLEIRHPSHPLHPLRLYVQFIDNRCICCGAMQDWLYHCKTCELFICASCAMKPIPRVEHHPKTHPHPLTFFPAQASLVCHFCAQIKNLDPTYICIQCVFAIHKKCIGFPHVVRISRHHHRMSFTSSLPTGNLSCGVCRQPVDNDYGAYTCSKGESYFVHSKCALDRRVWDEKYLDDVPEEDDVIDDGEPFERIADGVILHPCHSHNLKLETLIDYEETRFCRGCALPIYEGKFYSCVVGMSTSCDDFILHESCASAPRMIRHPLHPHPLTLQLDLKGEPFSCDACARKGSVLYYKHRIDKAIFMLDLRCASITEPFEYEGHQHPLYLPLEPSAASRCRMCKYESYDPKLVCMECDDDYRICYRCATFPYKARHKHGHHFLKLCRGKEASDQPDWCEVCEGKIEQVKDPGYRGETKTELVFYKCDDGCTTLHAECLLGRDMYMKPGNTVKLSCFSFELHTREVLRKCTGLPPHRSKNTESAERLE